MAASSITYLLPERRVQEDHAAADLADLAASTGPAAPAAPVAHGTVVSSQGRHATIRGLDVIVGDVVAISGWEAIPGPRRPGCFEPGVAAEVVAANGAEATVMPLVGGWTPAVGARVFLSRHGGLDP